MTLGWQRLYSKDKRIAWGDDYAGDAWRNNVTGEVRWVVVGYHPTGDNTLSSQQQERPSKDQS